MREFVFYSVLLFFCCSTFAQNLYLNNLVIESGSGAPVENVIIEIAETGLATKTRKDGAFRFDKAIPEGEHVLTISKTNYKTGFFLLKSNKGKPLELSTDKGVVVADKMEIKLDKYEAAKRKREAKAAAKEELKRLRLAKREKDIKDKLLAKKLRQLQKSKPKKAPVVVDEPIETTPSEDVITYSEAQFKYAEVLGVPIEDLSNKKLYDFIAEWEGTPYIMGGEGRDGIDCSAFSQRLFTEVYSMHLERTADRQYNSEESRKFKGIENADEGDLIFFSVVGNTPSDPITHVGVYLQNNKFVSATSKDSRAKGVKITDITDPYWKSRLVSFARRVENK